MPTVDYPEPSWIHLVIRHERMAEFTTKLTDLWGVVTSDFGCLFQDCPQPTAAVPCGTIAAATTTQNAA